MAYNHARPTQGILKPPPSIYPERQRILRWQVEGCDFGDGKKVVGKMVIDPGGWVTVKIIRRRKKWTLPLNEALSAIAIAAQRRECARILSAAPSRLAEDEVRGDDPRRSSETEGR